MIILLPVCFLVLSSAQTTTPPEREEDLKKKKEAIDELLETDEQLSSGFGFTYDAENRRDPFVNPLARLQAEEGDGQERPEGIGGMLVDEVTLIGLAETETGPIAVFMGTDNKGHFVRPGDSFWDAQVASIDLIEKIVIVEQRLQDITSPTRSRERQIKLHP